MANLPQGVSRNDFVHSVDHAIQTRQTMKILGQVDLQWDHPLDGGAEARSQFDRQVEAAIEVAGWAPFHHSRKTLDVLGQEVIHEPWRFYHLDREACLALLGMIDDVLDVDDRRGKIPGLLAAAGALVQITWLPEPMGQERQSQRDEAVDTSATDAKIQLRNQEHLAAASAAVQNLLLAAEARGLATYWSSGGILRDPRLFQVLRIPLDQQLLGSIFLAPAHDAFDGPIVTKTGSLREARARPCQWCRSVRLTP